MMQSNKQKTEVTPEDLAQLFTMNLLAAEQFKNPRQRRPLQLSGGFYDDVHDEVVPRDATAPEERQ